MKTTKIKGQDWLNTAVFYEIYPQSFYDSDGDGIGDIKGMQEKLPYLKDIGINAIWINPWYDSPFGDAGYDVRDYYKIAPRYGTNEDARRFLEYAHSLGFHVILDFVPGHTAVDCEWFKQTIRAEKNEYTDRYIWTNSAWISTDLPCLRGISDRNGSVAVNFFSHQPALNYGYFDRNADWQQSVDDEGPAATRRAMIDVMKFWIDMGADGFRVDMAGSLVKRDNAECEGNIAFWHKFRTELDQKVNGKPYVLVSEWGKPDKSIAAGFDMDFLLHVGHRAYMSLFRYEPYFFSGDEESDICVYADYYDEIYAKTFGKGLICVPSGNHDMWRLAKGKSEAQIKLCMFFLLLNSGAPFIYYGDEIGMKQLDNVTSVEGGYNRTGARTPMQWDNGINYGFSSARKTLMPVNVSDDAPTVESQLNVKGSLLETVKELIAFRKSHNAFFARSPYKRVYAKSHSVPFIFERGEGQNTYTVIVNPSKKDVKMPIEIKGKVEFVLGEYNENTNIISAVSGVVIKND